MAVRRLSKSRGLGFLSRQGLHTYLGELAENERELTAEIIEGVREAERRGLYFDYGYTSVFSYLMKEHGFSNGSAQRYIDAARLFAVVPTLTEDIASGSLKMAQVTVVATTVRQKKKEEPKFQMEPEQATAIFEKIKGENTDSSQQILAQELKVKIKEQEIARKQADGSVRREITLSKEDEEALVRIKELISHTHPNPSFVEVVQFLMNDYLKRKDPLLAKERKRKSAPKKTRERMNENGQESGSSLSSVDDKSNQGRQFHVVVDEQGKDSDRVASDKDQANDNSLEVSEQESSLAQTVGAKDQPISYHMVPKPQRRKYISVHTTRLVYQRDQCCQWRNPTTGTVCGSRFQLQRDHIQSLWAGGSDEPENLQMLCAQHNRLKYRREVGIKWVTE